MSVAQVLFDSARVNKENESVEVRAIIKHSDYIDLLELIGDDLYSTTTDRFPKSHPQYPKILVQLNWREV